MAKAKKLPSGRWRTLVYSHTEKGWDESSQSFINKRKYESFDGDTAAESEYNAFKFKLERKRMARPENLTLSEAIDKYIYSCDNLLSPTTIQGYRKIQRNAFKSILDVKIASLTNEMLLNAVNEEAKRVSNKNTKNPKPISPKHLHNEYGFIRSVLHRYAPMLDTNVKLPQKVVKIKEIIEPETSFRLIRSIWLPETVISSIKDGRESLRTITSLT